MISDCLQILYLVHKCCSRYPRYFIYRGLSYNYCGILGLDVFNPFTSLAFQHLYFIIILNYIPTLVVVASAHGPVFAVCCLWVGERWGDGSLRDTSPPPWGIAVGCLLSIFSCSSRRLSYVNPAHLATSNENSFSICILNCF